MELSDFLIAAGTIAALTSYWVTRPKVSSSVADDVKPEVQVKTRYRVHHITDPETQGLYIAGYSRQHPDISDLLHRAMHLGLDLEASRERFGRHVKSLTEGGFITEDTHELGLLLKFDRLASVPVPANLGFKVVDTHVKVRIDDPDRQFISVCFGPREGVVRHAKALFDKLQKEVDIGRSTLEVTTSVAGLGSNLPLSYISHPHILGNVRLNCRPALLSLQLRVNQPATLLIDMSASPKVSVEDEPYENLPESHGYRTERLRDYMLAPAEQNDRVRKEVLADKQFIEDLTDEEFKALQIKLTEN